MKKLCALGFIVLLLMSCSRDKSPVTPSSGDALGFYFLADDSISLYNIGDYSVENLELEESPWLSDKDILTYNFSKHMIYLNKPLKNIFPQFASSEKLMQEYNVKPFVVVADGEACYLAAFHAVYSSLGRMTPHIDLLTIDLNTANSVVIHREWELQDRETIDHRNDPRVAKILKELGKYSDD